MEGNAQGVRTWGAEYPCAPWAAVVLPGSVENLLLERLMCALKSRNVYPKTRAVVPSLIVLVGFGTEERGSFVWLPQAWVLLLVAAAKPPSRQTDRQTAFQSLLSASSSSLFQETDLHRAGFQNGWWGTAWFVGVATPCFVSSFLPALKES